MHDGRNYHNGFVDYAYNAPLSLEYMNKYENSITWNGDIIEENVLVIATVFNPVANIGYANPPESMPFEAYYVDATAAAYPNQTGSNLRNEQYTHNVFIEEGTGTWCPSCPPMAEVLHNISKMGEYPFYYTAIVEDMTKNSTIRLVDDYNIYGYPTAFFDGGKKVVMGSGRDEAYFISIIETCAKSDVHDLDLNLSVKWLGDGKLKIDFNITSLEELTEHNFEINKIRGGIQRAYAVVENTDETDKIDVDWQIIVKGGLKNRINSTTSGTINDFPTGSEKIIRTKTRLFEIYGIGLIDIVVKIGTTVKTASGLELGGFIIVK